MYQVFNRMVITFSLLPLTDLPPTDTLFSNRSWSESLIAVLSFPSQNQIGCLFKPLKSDTLTEANLGLSTVHVSLDSI